MVTFLQDLLKAIGNMPKQAKKRCDKSIVLIVMFLLMFGLIMIWSASMYNAQIDFNDELHYVKKQFIFAGAGLILMYFISLIDYRFIKKYAHYFMALVLVMLGIVAVLGFASDSDIHGATRWFSIGSYGLQPSEFAKVGVLLFLAKQFEKRNMRDARTFGYVILFIILVCGLVVIQPALSTSIIIGGLIIGLYFIAGGNLFYIVTTIGAGVGTVLFYIFKFPWRAARFAAYLDPWSDFHGTGWQPAQSLMALGSGGLFGVGVGNGVAKLSFLPESQNDYIFAIIGEELGLLGCLALLVVFFIFVIRLLYVSVRTKDRFAALVVSGTAVLIAIQVFINIGVVTNLLPSTGVTLPFISYGGSSLVSFIICLGIVLNISRNLKATSPNRSVS